MDVADRGAAGYVVRAGGNDRARTLAGWTGYTACPVDEHGRYPVRFR